MAVEIVPHFVQVSSQSILFFIYGCVIPVVI